MSALAQIPDSTPALKIVTDPLTPIFAEAKRIFEDILGDEERLYQSRDAIMVKGWRLGARLAAMKEILGHGKWLFWLGANWPELGERNARRCIAMFLENSESADSADLKAADFDPESKRRFMWGYVPEKERPQLPGNHAIPRIVTQLTFVNHWFRFRQRVKEDLDVAPDMDTIRHDLEPALKDMAELVGKEWMREVLS